MVPTRLTFALLVFTLSGCASSMDVPLAISNYCEVSRTHYPLRPSRKDTKETKRQIAQANTIYERLCNGTPREKED